MNQAQFVITTGALKCGRYCYQKYLLLCTLTLIEERVNNWHSYMLTTCWRRRWCVSIEGVSHTARNCT